MRRRRSFPTARRPRNDRPWNAPIDEPDSISRVESTEFWRTLMPKLTAAMRRRAWCRPGGRCFG
jgi:hypothetical protein